MIHIPFYTIAERKPEHNQDIIWLRRRDAFEMASFEPRQITVEYSWDEVDEDGYSTGNSYLYDPKEIEMFNDPSLELRILLDGWVADDLDLWCPVDEYWEAFNTILENSNM